MWTLNSILVTLAGARILAGKPQAELPTGQQQQEKKE